ncbi:PilN domain-containing protein [Salinispirillum marinum]|uniref:PilN domain-containing protein n=2 Tax=Saccharospirillaceae TaxID=255527 RepID=A0ABV8BBD4_9GAMM
MITLNLLPWREQLRKQRKAQFVRVMFGVAVLSGLIILAGQQYLATETQTQIARNQYIQGELRVLDQRISEINTLRTERADLVERMQVIQQLQGDRPIIVYVFDELARITPQAVYFNSFNNTGRQIQMAGIAESTTAISQLMRNMENSTWFTNPVLGSVVSETTAGVTRHRFQLRVTQVTPSVEE